MDKLFDVTNEIDTAGLDPIDFVKLLPVGDSDIRCQYFESGEDVPDPSEFSCKDKNLIIFEDVLLDKQKKIESYFTRGRHSNIDCFYLSQNYHRLLRQTIRENANLIVLFEQDLITLRYIFADHCSVDFEKFEDFKKLATKVWSKPHAFLTIDLTKDKEDGKYKNCLTPIKF